ncbi:alpha/beta hydrolase family protein [Pelagovum pacificum]|uniref:Alpha/beta hydrolase n=1 Tax=Pelagovum pacificum TaxID=2588711 RepID=A0A5C5G8V2_9RHOB|nr:alpha/beta fold hydrolase [Pelagovum pacificum]QQA42067.1 alpha/beta hydrolase [Pelagovum pacificum]TNY31156.1 alpha/beta hydrolase [Pelagovum pacificum]
MIRTIATLTLGLLPVAALAQVTETDVTFQSDGQDVIATLALPEGAPAPVVLLLHGFSGSRDEVMIESVGEGIFERTARLLAEDGYASLRIDFRGSGDSIADMSYAETTFETQVADALAAMDYLEGLDEVSGEDLYIIGWSQGGAVATGAAGRSNTPDAVALWAAVADPVPVYSGILGTSMVEEGRAIAGDENVSMTLPWGAELVLNGTFFQSLATYSPTEEIAAYDGPLFVAQGSLDTTVPPGNADLLLEAHEGEEDFWGAEMDHVFNAFSTVDTLDEMVAATAAYFDAH